MKWPVAVMVPGAAMWGEGGVSQGVKIKGHRKELSVQHSFICTTPPQSGGSQGPPHSLRGSALFI